MHLLQTVIFLYPTNKPVDRSNTEVPPGQTDSLVRGLVELYVPSARHISGIKVKLRAIQTVAILDANTGVIPVSWEDEVLMEKQVYIGMQPKLTKKEKEKERGRSERGRTPGPSASRLPGSSRPPSIDLQADSRRSSRQPSRQASRAPSRDATARNSLDTPQDDAPAYTVESHDHDHSSFAANITSAFARAVSRGRPAFPQSRPNSRPNSRSRASSPSDPRRGESTPQNSSHNPRSISRAPSIIAPSPVVSPREERPRPELTPSSSRGQISQDVDLGSLSIGNDVERNRSANHVGGLGHPEDDDFGLAQRPGNFNRNDSDSSTPSTSGFGAPRNSSQGPMSQGGFSKRRDPSKGPGSVPPPAGRNTQRSTSKGWPRWARSVSRARGTGQRDASVASTSRTEHADDDHPPDGLELEKGVHGFEFAFIIPADSPEYTRSPFGRVRYVIKATAYGAGRARSNLEAWRDCFPVANPSLEGGPLPLTVLYHDMHPTVGLLSIACTSQNISVGGLFQLDVHSPTPPPDLYIYMVRVSIDTTIHLKTKRKGKQTVPSQRHKLYEKGYVPPSKGDPHAEGDGKKSEGFVRDPTRDGPDSAWTVQGLARMPDDNSIRASTIGGTKASIRFSHLLIVEVVHSREPEPGEERKLKVFTLRQPVTLPSCCVAFDAATLPAYTREDEDPSRFTVAGLPYDLAHHPDGALRKVPDPSATANASGSGGPAAGPGRPSTLKPLRGQGHEYCVCGLSLQDLEVRERAMIPVGTNYDIPIDNLRPHGKIGELPISRTRSGSTSRSRRRSSASSQRPASLVGRRGSGSSGVAGALARSLSRSGHSGRGRSPSASGADRRSGSLARSRTRDSGASGGSNGALGGELVGGSSIGRNVSRGSSRLGVYSTTASNGEGSSRVSVSDANGSTASAGQPPPPPPTTSQGTALDSSVSEQPSRAASPVQRDGAPPAPSGGEEPPSYVTALDQVDEEAVASDDEGEEEDEPERGRRR